jgi:hypothetical protein
MKNKLKTDELCKYYLDGMAFFVHNMEVLEEHAKRMRAEGKDPYKDEHAIRRLQAAKEGLQRMLSDRVKALEGGTMDEEEIMVRLAEWRMEDETRDQVLNSAITLIVRQREKLTNADRGRRALQKQLGYYKRQAHLLGKEAAKLKENNEQLRVATAQMVRDRTNILMDHALHHHVDGDNPHCEGCPMQPKCAESAEVCVEVVRNLQDRMGIKRVEQ